MTLANLIAENQSVLVQRWLELALGDYPRPAQRFFGTTGDHFGNPVGYVHRRVLPLLLEELVGEMRPEQLCQALEQLLRVRVVQELSPAQALRFVLGLKDLVRELAVPGPGQLEEFERRVDQLLLFAIDIYSKLREELYRLRVEEVKRSVSTLMKRSGYFAGPGPEGERADCGGSVRPGE